MTATYEDEIRALTDEQLDREIAFSQGFAITDDPNAVAWDSALYAEKDRRAR